MKVFCERLKDLREEQNLSTRQLAKEIGVTNISISRWEREERIPNIENLVAIAKYFKVSTDYLCGLEDQVGLKYENFC